MGWVCVTEARRMSSIPSQVIPNTSKTRLVTCSFSRSVLMDGCNGKLHTRCCHWLATNVAFTKVTAWPLPKQTEMGAANHSWHSKRSTNASVMKLNINKLWLKAYCTTMGNQDKYTFKTANLHGFLLGILFLTSKNQDCPTFLKIIFHTFSVPYQYYKKVSTITYRHFSKFAFKKHNFTKNNNCFICQ